MKRTIEPNIQAQTELAQLRELLDEAERRIVTMHQAPDGALTIIRSLDDIERRLAAAREGGRDVRAEEGRADSLRRRLVRGAPGVIRLLQAADQTAQVADSPTYKALEDARIEESRRRVRGLLTFGLPVLAVMLTLIVLTLLNPPPPQANLNPVRQLTQDGQLDQALARARSESQRVPSDSEAVLWVGALQLATGDATGAEASWAQAQALLNDETRFHFDRGNALLGVNLPDAAEADARWLIERPESAAPGYLLLGGVEELRGNVPEAITAFETAASLANKAGNSQLEVIAKTRLGFLMQSGAGMLPPTPTP